MDNEIKRLLKLEQIKGFNLLDSEKKKLADWKKQQKRVKVSAPKKIEVPEDHTIMEMGANDTPTIVANEDLGEKPAEVKVVKNIVEPEDKTVGSVEE